MENSSRFSPEPLRTYFLLLSVVYRPSVANMRSSRRKKAPAKNISSDYFVGYVEDDESVEAIMKKFQELESIQKEFLDKRNPISFNSNPNSSPPPDSELKEKASAPVSLDSAELNHECSKQSLNDKSSLDAKAFEAKSAMSSFYSSENQLPDEVLAEVFKRTSAFTVKGALMDQDELDILDDVDLWKTEKDQLSDEYQEEDEYLDADDDFWDEEFGLSHSSKSKNKRKSIRAFSAHGTKLGLRDQIIQRYKYMQVQIKDKAGHTFLVKRKVNTVNPMLPTYTRIPPYPISHSWAKTILPFTNKTYINNSTRSVKSILELSWSTFNSYQAIYMDPPLIFQNIKNPNSINVDCLENIPVNKMLCPGGFVFIWCEKEIMPDIFRLAENKWSLKYVENFCWIKKSTNNQIHTYSSKYFCRSKLTCLIFRAQGELEIRHQRSPDCVFDFVKPRLDGIRSEEKPKFIYKIIETLLPGFTTPSDSSSNSQLLNLWAPQGYQRSNWEMISEI